MSALAMSPELPTGTITFLFTDVEGSTRLWEQVPAAMRAALERHDQIVETAVAQNAGRLVKPRGEGDSRFAVFRRATDAVAAARDMQAGLSRENWQTPKAVRIRIALHTGEADLRAGDYYGSDVNRCARLRAIAHGGQTLLSQATRDLIRDALPANVALRDLGEHRLKDLQHPEHVYQLDITGLPAEFPRLLSVDAFPNNLPVQLTTFVGREPELAEVKRLLTTTHLLTLTGPGGTGKTRLSLQLAAEVLEEFTHGVWLIELAPLADPTLVTQTVASTLDVREQPGRTILDALVDYLRAKNLLLILDNCEHVIEASAQVANTLLRAAPRLKILASSREALGITGEISYRVPSLSLPDLHQPTFEMLSRNDCIRLFVERALAVSPRFQLTEKNVAAVAQICSRLDGIPLAIELAAARTIVFSPEQIALRLSDRFRLLTGGSRTALPRQQTLRALIDWSYDLLPDSERTLLHRLSVFAGGFSFDAAQMVCGDRLGDDVLDALTQLIDKSLVVVDQPGEAGEASYHLLETIRQYARDKLLESGESEQVRDRHLDFFLHFAEEAEPKLRSGEQLAWLERVEIEHDNLRAALGWSLESGKRDAALRLAGAAYWFWFIRGYWSEGQRWLDEALALDERAQSERAANVEKYIPARTETAQRAKALYGVGKLRYTALGLLSEAVRAKLEESLRLWRMLEDKWWVALVLIELGQVNFTTGDLSIAQAQCKEGVALARQTEDRWVLAVCLTKLGLVTGPVDSAAARSILEEAVTVARMVGDRSILSYALVNLVTIYFFQGDYGVITPLAEEALTAARAIGSRLDVLFGLAGVGLAALARGNLKQAIETMNQLLAFAREMGSPLAIAFALIGFGAVAVVSGQPRRAVLLFGVIESLWRSIGIDINAWGGRTGGAGGSGAVYRKFLQAARAQLDEATFDAAMAEGRALTLEQAIALAMEVKDHL